MQLDQVVDSHCHIPLIDHAGGPRAIIHAAQEAGVGRLLCVSIELETVAEIKQLAHAYPCVSASVGVHPNHIETGPPVSVDALLAQADDPQVIAIGETGLDFFRSEGDLEWQRARFRTHIRAARQIGKPLIIHCREAAADVIRILSEEKAAEVGGIMHCFVEDLDTAKAAMDMNFYISFSGILTFKNARDVQAVAAQLPLDRILVETDSPYLAPAPYRGKQNEPKYVPLVAAKLAELHQLETATVCATTTRNYLRLFEGDSSTAEAAH